MGTDATVKVPGVAGDERDGLPVRDFSPLLFMDEEVRKPVEGRVGEFGLG